MFLLNQLIIGGVFFGINIFFFLNTTFGLCSVVLQLLLQMFRRSLCCVCCWWQAWLAKLAEEMKHTLQSLLRDCLSDSKSSKGGLDPNKYPSQVKSHCPPWCKPLVPSSEELAE